MLLTVSFDVEPGSGMGGKCEVEGHSRHSDARYHSPYAYQLSVRPERSEAKSKGNNTPSLELTVVQDSRPGHDPFETFIPNQSTGGHIRRLKQ